MYYPSAVGSVVMPSVVAPSVHAQSVVAAPGMMMPAASYAQPAYGYGHSYYPGAMPAYHAPPVYAHHSYGYRAPTVLVSRRSRWRRSGFFGYY